MTIKASVTEKQCQDVMYALLNDRDMRPDDFACKLNLTQQQVNEAFIFLDQQRYFDNMRLIRDADENYSFVSTSNGMTINSKGMDFMTTTPQNSLVEIEVRKESNNIRNSSKNQGIPTIFVSYNWGSTEYVDELDAALEGKALLHRDTKKVGTWASISEFMDTIRDQNFAVLVISDAYLKSLNCMHEVMQLMKEQDWQTRVMSIVREDAKIYRPLERAEYVSWWANESKELTEKIENLPASAVAELSDDLRKTQEICNKIDTFLKYVSDIKNPTETEALSKIIERLNRTRDCTKSQVLFDEYPDKIYRAQLELDKKSNELLISACSGNGSIYILNTLGGKHIKTSKSDFTASRDQRTIAMWSGAIEELYRNRLIQMGHQRDTFVETYEVTYKGYQYYDQLIGKIE